MTNSTPFYLQDTPPLKEVSFEFFPAKTDEGSKSLWNTITYLAPFAPDFVSVTYGAGGSTRERTHETVTRIRNETSLEPAAHLTCVGSPKEEIHEIAKQYWKNDIKHIVALRGDMPGGGAYTPHPDGYRYATDLIAGLKDIAPFEISVSAYPEAHPEAGSIDDDIAILKEKQEAGATRAITQYFFDPTYFLRFVEKARAKGVTIPIVPGILVISNIQQMQKFSAMCGTDVPEALLKRIAHLDETPEERDLITTALTAELCRCLMAEGIDSMHFYTLNRAKRSAALCDLLGMKRHDTA